MDVLDLRRVSYFVEVAREKSFSRAAENLFVAQSTISQQIGALEDSLGVLLLERNRKTVNLTEAGLAFMDYAERLLALSEASITYMQEFAKAHSAPTIRVGLDNVDYYFGRSDFSLLSEFSRSHPNLTPELSFLDFSTILRKLNEGILDVAFLLITQSELSALEHPYRILHTGQDAVGVPLSYIEAKPNANWKDAVGDLNIFLMQGDSRWDKHTEQVLEESGHSPKYHYVRDVHQLYECAASGMGAGVASSHVLAQYLLPKQILEIKSEKEQDHSIILWRSESYEKIKPLLGVFS